MRVLASSPESMMLLGEVGELEVQTERPQDECLLVCARKGLDLDRLLVARRARRMPSPLDELEEPLALLLHEHVPEDGAEQPNVAPQWR
jgi:hypothetical protein